MPILIFISQYKRIIEFALAAVIVVLAVHFYNDWQQGIGVAREHVLRVAEQQQYAQALRDAQIKGEQDAQKLQTAIDADRATAQAQRVADAAAISSLALSLRDRAQRPSGAAANVPGAASSGQGGCHATGAGLYFEDSQYVAGLAADAASLRTALKQCYAAYDRARSLSLPTPQP